MGITKLANPHGQVVTIPMADGMKLDLSFDPTQESIIVRDGEDLVFIFPDGGEIILENFYGVDVDAMPAMDVAGAQESAVEFLASLGDDSLLPAVAPAEAKNQQEGSGSGAYGDAAGQLIGGVDHLGTLGRDFWDSLREHPLTEISVSASAMPEGSTTPGSAVNPPLPPITPPEPPVTPPTPPAPPIPQPPTPPAPPPPPQPQPPRPIPQPQPPRPIPQPEPPTPPEPPAPPVPVALAYQARGILYMDGNTPKDNFSFQALNGSGVDAHPIAPGSVPAAGVSIVSAAEGQQGYATYTYDQSSGTINYHLTEAGKAALAALNGGNLYDYITVTVGGSSYNMQIVVTPGMVFDSAAQDAADVAAGLLKTDTAHILWGEWHSEVDSDGDTPAYSVRSSNGNDILEFNDSTGVAFTGELYTNDGNDTVTFTGATAAVADSFVNTGRGDDTITANGAVVKSYIAAEFGDDTVTVNGTVDNSTITGGWGTDKVIVNGDVTDYSMIYAGVGGDGANLYAPDASSSNTIIVNGRIDTSYAYGDNGQDTITVNGSMNESAIYGEGGDDLITVTSVSADAAMRDSDAMGGDGDDTINITAQNSGDVAGIISGVVAGDDGNDRISIIATSTGGTATGDISGFVRGDQGDDSITIAASSASGDARGVTYYGYVYGGDGNDNISISASATNGQATGVDTGIVYGDNGNFGGAGNDIISITASSAGTGDAEGLRDSVVDGNDGDNSITITATAENGSATGAGTVNPDPYMGYGIYGGSGRDTITVNASSSNGSAVGLSDFTVESGDGDDSVAINATGSDSAYGVYYSTVKTDSGNDSVTITAKATGDYGFSAALETGTVDTGAGNDTITITAEAPLAAQYPYFAYAVQGDSAANRSKIIAGAGSDNVTLNGDVIFGDFALGRTLGAADTLGVNDVNTLNVKGNVSYSNIYGDAGTDDVHISGGTKGLNISMGLGSDSLLVDKTVSASIIHTGTGDGGPAPDSTGAGDVNFVTMGGMDNSVLYGDAGADSVTVNGKVTDSTISTGAGDDNITAGRVEKSFIYGGDGNDAITTGDVITSTVNGDAGDDIIRSATISSGGFIGGGEGNDRITFDTLKNYPSAVNGGFGDDIITGNLVTDSSRVDGGAGNDTITLGTVDTGSWVLGGDGDDHITIDNASGAVIYGDDGNDSGVSGNDVINIGSLSGSSVVNAGYGDDIVTVSTLNSSMVFGESGDDAINITTMNSGFVSGGDGNDVITLGTMNGGSVYGEAGNDIISSGLVAGYGRIDGGAGDDSIVAGALDTGGSVDGGDGNDTIATGDVTSSSYVAGGNDNDFITTGAVTGYSVVSGDAGDDHIITGSVDSSTIMGGTGADTIEVKGDVTGNSKIYTGSNNSGGGVDITDVSDNSVSVSGVVDHSFIYGDAGRDNVSVTGSVTFSTISTGAGDDSIDLGDVSQYTIVNGDAGDDVITYKTLSEHSGIQGGDGNDMVVAKSGLSGGAYLDGGTGYDTLRLDVTGIASVAQLMAVYAGLFTAAGSGITFAPEVLNFEHLQLTSSSGVSSAISDALNAGGVNWALVQNVNLDVTPAFTQGTDQHTDYALSGTSLGQDLNLSLDNSDDTITLKDITAHTVDLGHGFDHLTVGGAVSGAVITGAATVELGGQAEMDSKHIDISGLLSNSSITTGSGNDVVHLNGGVSGSHIDLGAGDDRLVISGDILNTTIHGGAGNDSIDLGHGAHSNVTLTWDAGDASAVNHYSDVVSGFKAGLGSGADTLDVQGLLSDVKAGGDSLSDLLSFTVEGGNTTIHISGADGSGGHAPVQDITLTGVELNHSSAVGTYDELAHQIHMITGS